MAKVEISSEWITIISTVASIAGGGYLWTLKAKKTKHDQYKDITENTIQRLENDNERLRNDNERLRKNNENLKNRLDNNKK